MRIRALLALVVVGANGCGWAAMRNDLPSNKQPLVEPTGKARESAIPPAIRLKCPMPSIFEISPKAQAVQLVDLKTLSGEYVLAEAHAYQLGKDPAGTPVGVISVSARVVDSTVTSPAAEIDVCNEANLGSGQGSFVSREILPVVLHVYFPSGRITRHDVGDPLDVPLTNYPTTAKLSADTLGNGKLAMDVEGKGPPFSKGLLFSEWLTSVASATSQMHLLPDGTLELRLRWYSLGVASDPKISPPQLQTDAYLSFVRR
jgi:hypothetical protein